MLDWYRVLPGVLWLGLSAAAGCCSLLFAQTRPPNEGLHRSAPDAIAAGATHGPPVQAARLRGGMHLSDAVGHFHSTAEGLVFIHEDGRRLAGLENLNLQRIAGTLRAARKPASVQWRVSGLVTQYEGRNFILIQRAVCSPSPR